jgi:triphosphoribosyl-dephospho-CoA synthase
MLSLGQCATLACVLEASAPKVGNVHRDADFDDMTFIDLVTAAVAIGPAFDAVSPHRRANVGLIIHDAIDAMRAAAGCNAYLGTVLLIAPLAAVPCDKTLLEGVRDVLSGLDRADAELVYDAIRRAKPGGLGRVDQADVTGPAPDDLVAAMRLAADRDLVARQYANGFATIFGETAPSLRAAIAAGASIADAIVHVQLETMSRYPDSLIARKCGLAIAQQSADRAAHVLAAGKPGDQAYHEALAGFDFWLRADGHRRNPGTTADLIAAALFALLRDGQLSPPWRFYRTGE